MNNKLMLVTGANGYVGLEIVKMLSQQSIPTRAMVRSLENAKELQKISGVEIVVGDIRNLEDLRKACNGVYGIFHIAAIFRQANFTESVFHDINAQGTKNVLDVAIEKGVKRVIHCSTGGVLGHIAYPPGNENSPFNPGDAYQRTKLEGENIAMQYFRENKISGVVIRPAMIYGPADTRNLKLFKMISRNKFFYVGDGATYVHFVDVRDLAKAFILAMEHEELNAQIYHIPGEKAVPFKTLVEVVANHLGVSKPWIHIPVRPMQMLGSLCEAICVPFGIQPPLYRRRVDFFTKNRHFDGSKAKQDLGYKPAKDFVAEVKEVTDWYKQNNWL